MIDVPSIKSSRRDIVHMSPAKPRVRVAIRGYFVRYRVGEIDTAGMRTQVQLSRYNDNLIVSSSGIGDNRECLMAAKPHAEPHAKPPERGVHHYQ